MRRLAAASFFCCASGHGVTSSTLSAYPDGDVDHLAEAFEIEAAVAGEGVPHEARDVDGAEAAAAVGRKRLLAAVRGRSPRRRARRRSVQVVVAVDAVARNVVHAGLGVVVGPRAHRSASRSHRSWTAFTLRARRPAARRRAGRRRRPSLPAEGSARCGRKRSTSTEPASTARMKRVKSVTPTGDVEVGESRRSVLGVDEALDVRVVATPGSTPIWASRRAASRPRTASSRLAALVEGSLRRMYDEPAVVVERARARVGALHPRAFGA